MYTNPRITTETRPIRNKLVTGDGVLCVTNNLHVHTEIWVYR